MAGTAKERLLGHRRGQSTCRQRYSNASSRTAAHDASAVAREAAHSSLDFSTGTPTER